MSFATHQAIPPGAAEPAVFRSRSAHSRRGRVCTRTGRGFAVGALLALSILPAQPAQAQVGRAALGLIGGLAAGVHITTGVFVVRSRVFGHDMHSTEDLVTIRPETLPIVVLPVAGALVGYQSSTRLAGAATWGGFGLVAGAAAGAGLGHLLSGTSGGRWAGGTIGSAAGLALGVMLGAALSSDDEDVNGGAIGVARYVGISIPFGRGR